MALSISHLFCLPCSISVGLQPGTKSSLFIVTGATLRPLSVFAKKELYKALKSFQCLPEYMKISSRGLQGNI
jgi:hypothetical protein